MKFNTVLILCGLVLLSYLFFHLALDNGFWHSDDFNSLDHSIQMRGDPSRAFDSAPPFRFQPLAYLAYYILFKTLFFDAEGYFLFNIILHGLNAFLVYLLVQTTLKDRAVALLSAVLFVFTVGSYGKSVMIASGLEDLLITTLTLLTMIFYFKNELDSGGKVLGAWYILAFVFFLASMLTRSTSFAILGAFLAFNFFFRAETNKRVLSPNFLILLVLAAGALIVKAQVFHYKPQFYPSNPGVWSYIYLTVKNIFNYLVRMVFPIHTSHLVTQSGMAVRFVYRFATEIRIIIALTIVSYSFFGFIFGNRPIRFFIAWTYIMVLPFAFFQFPADWLNIRHLYLVSVGFVVVISTGAVFCSRLIAHNKYRRFIPMIVPLFFVILSRFVIGQLDRSYELKASSPEAAEMRSALAERHEEVSIENGELIFRE
ncbi:MAG TPA: hypothetical protein ENO08_03245 [Candidatus Eisenbacteria bacterium]|uniref:Glycosyltransferase RgtA/B/C/D-like domain-containing protein n=1 Tax=Eiseniibacteriota bacterium TaxID=2212470 RepID=A0A7V2AUI0_UNCEI|nr:hypothetical protein [Candidatus Eisenbacteria bacterium]